jgi:hypothetical protein
MTMPSCFHRDGFGRTNEGAMAKKHFVALLLALSSAAAFTSYTQEAAACGGCFAPPETPTVVSDHRMIFSVSPTQSTLYDQIRYSGDPQSFAWVLPYSGEITVGLSADAVFGVLDQFTQTQIIPPNPSCPPPPQCPNGFSSSSSGTSGSAGPTGVNVIKREVVGPYETVQLSATNPNALNTWLSTNGFNVPADVQPVITKYQQENFNFLALRLQPGKDVKDMRPVRVTTQGANIALPLRMVAAGTGPVVGISLWIISSGRYEPQNFTSFIIREDELTWDWASSRSDYTALRAQRSTAGNGRTWEIESSIETSASIIQTSVRSRSASDDYLPVTTGTPKTASEVRDEDLAALLASGASSNVVRLTRMRADLAHAALDTDLVLRASSDQSVLSNVRRVSKSTGAGPCPTFPPCSDGTTSSSGNSSGTTSGNTAANTPVRNDGETFQCASSSAVGDEDRWASVGLAFCAFGAALVIRTAKKKTTTTTTTTTTTKRETE